MRTYLSVSRFSGPPTSNEWSSACCGSYRYEAVLANVTVIGRSSGLKQSSSNAATRNPPTLPAARLPSSACFQATVVARLKDPSLASFLHTTTNVVLPPSTSTSSTTTSTLPLHFAKPSNLPLPRTRFPFLALNVESSREPLQRQQVFAEFPPVA